MPSLRRPALDPEVAQKLREAGRIARGARELGVSLIRPGASLLEVMEAVETYIRDHGAGPAFPAQTSRNQIAAHYCPAPTDSTRYREEDVVKIDIGVEVEGWIADTATTVYLGDEADPARLVAAAQAGLAAGIAAAGPGVRVPEISAAIERAIEGHGAHPVYNLTGHGLDRWKVHTAPQIPASPDPHDRAVLHPGMIVAIEPFATDGRGHVLEQGRAEVFMLIRTPRKNKGLDPRAWKVIEDMNGLPFARRSFPPSIPREAVESTLARLLRTGCAIAFPPLADPVPEVRIAQAEHTLIVTENGVETTTA